VTVIVRSAVRLLSARCGHELAVLRAAARWGAADPETVDAIAARLPAAPALERMAARNESRLITAYARHGSAKAARDGAALMEAAEEMAAIGALRYAVEAASDAATAYVTAGRQDSARRAAARARHLHVADQGAELPRIDGLGATAIELTPRATMIHASP
jgi:hypothetical protein